jgi:putative DNA primase/helicase
MTDITTILKSDWESQEYKFPPEEQLLRAMAKEGLHPESVEIDGQMHRFGNNNSGWYIAFPSEIPAGCFGDWKRDIEQPWRAVISRNLSPVEALLLKQRLEEAMSKRRLERECLAAEAATKAADIFSRCEPTTADHPYLQSKRVHAYSLRVSGDSLVAPMFNKEGSIISIQYISPEGRKRFITDSAIKGGFWWLSGDNSIIYVAEGFATAASIHAATGKTTFIAYAAFNIPLVVKMLREQYGNLKNITVVVDNDDHSVGERYTKLAVDESSCNTIKPPFGDANDYAREHDLKEFLEPTVKLADNWLVPALSLCADFKPIKWLIKRMIPRESLVMIYGPSGAGKTFCVLDMCMSIASGRKEWFGLKVNKGSVVYLAGEGQAGLRQRVAAWNQAYTPSSLDMFVSKDGCDLNTSAGLQKIVQSIDQNTIKPDLIVVDTLHRFLLGDENSAQDTKGLLDSCAALINHYSCSVLLVHHTGVSETAQARPRGSSAWYGALDSGICMVPAKEDGTPIQIIQYKAKDGEAAVPLFAGLDSIPIKGWVDDDGDQITSAVLVARSAATKPADKAKELFELAWDRAGREEVDGYPYISRSAFQAYLEREQKLDYRSAQRDVKKLVASLKLTPKESGWTNEKPS